MNYLVYFVGAILWAYINGFLQVIKDQLLGLKMMKEIKILNIKQL
jgi:hypothetical protein